MYNELTINQSSLAHAVFLPKTIWKFRPTCVRIIHRWSWASTVTECPCHSSAHSCLRVRAQTVITCLTSRATSLPGKAGAPLASSLVKEVIKIFDEGRFGQRVSITPGIDYTKESATSQVSLQASMPDCQPWKCIPTLSNAEFQSKNHCWARLTSSRVVGGTYCSATSSSGDPAVSGTDKKSQTQTKSNTFFLPSPHPHTINNSTYKASLMSDQALAARQKIGAILHLQPLFKPYFVGLSFCPSLSLAFGLPPSESKTNVSDQL